MTIDGSKWDQDWNAWKAERLQPYQGSFTRLPTLPECHTGNTLILNWGNGAGLYAGGWTRDAKPGDNWVVINLSEYHRPTMYTGNHKAIKLFTNSLQGNQELHKGITLHFPIRDYDTPYVTHETWNNLANDVQGILERGINVLIACDGGHGRTGMVVAILATLIDDHECTLPDPVAWIREVYCSEAIETIKQEYYVYDTLGIDPPLSPTVTQHTQHTQETRDLLPEPITYTSNDDIPDDWQLGTCWICRSRGRISPQGFCYECMVDQGLITECDYCGQYKPVNSQNICQECMDELHENGIHP